MHYCRKLVCQEKYYQVFYLSNTPASSHGNRNDFLLMKVGDKKTIQKYARAISQAIKEEVGENAFAITQNPSYFLANAAYLLSNEVSKSLSKPFELFFQKPWKMKKYYCKIKTKEREKILDETVSFNGRLNSSKSVVLIDDCVTTGTALRSCIKKLLQKGFKNIYCFTCFNFKDPEEEERLAYIKLDKKGTKFVERIISGKKNFLTGRALTLLLELPRATTNSIIAKASKDRKNEILPALAELGNGKPLYKKKIKEILQTFGQEPKPQPF